MRETGVCALGFHSLGNRDNVGDIGGQLDDQGFGAHLPNLPDHLGGAVAGHAKAAPPALTLGQEMLSSIISTAVWLTRSTILAVFFQSAACQIGQ